MNMEGSVRSGGVLKKKSSSGCLIIKNKVGNKNSGGGSGGLSLNSKEKKRPRLAAIGSESSVEDESLEIMRRKVSDKRLHNGSVGYTISDFENRAYSRKNGGIEVSDERKRSRLDLFEFDEYDEFDGKRMRNEYVDDRYKMVGRSGSGNSMEYGVGPSHGNLVVNKRKGSHFDVSSSGRVKGLEYGGLRNTGLVLEEEEAHMPISLLRLKYQETSDEPIRLQGKSGVLKVMVNKKKKMDLPSQHNFRDPKEVEEREGSRSEDFARKDMSARKPTYTASTTPANRETFYDKKVVVEKEKTEVKLKKVKPITNKDMKARESKPNDNDTTLRLAPPGLPARELKKKLLKEEERSPPPENVTPVKGKEVKEGKVKRSGSTEKQMLRDKIRGMLVDAGWTIEYRPRQKRDYLDAVYINPSGTAYWSIIKAYDALKKQLEEDNTKSKSDVGSPSFAPLSEDLINKLTRRTKKKIEEEMKRKRKEDRLLTKGAKRSAVRDAMENSDSNQNEDKVISCKKRNKSQGGKLCEPDEESEEESSDDLRKRKNRKVRVDKPITGANSSAVQGRTSKIIGRCTLLVRGSDKGQNSESDGYNPYSGKRTVLAWLIDSGTAQSNEKVQYMNRRRTRVMLEGWITREGIHCGCCSKILTVSKFELHAGSKLRQPFQNIFLESGSSLLQCQLDAWNRQGEYVRRNFQTVDADGDDPDDDTCGICGDGGALICCDSCPSTFHTICLEIKMLPSGDWHCSNCICKFCGEAGGNASEENDSTADELMRCSCCGKKYHKSCCDGVCALPLSSNSASFCGLKCQELYDHLKKILGVRHELELGFSWSLIQQANVSDTSLRGFSQRVECNSKLAVALSVMDECFLPIIDRRSGINMIRNVVYSCGSNFNRLNYSGFYTAVLERGDEIVSTASIRVHGAHLAEMPFIGTREIYRRQGMCRRLLSAIETVLGSLKVEQLIIPAISEHMNTWTTAFGFHQLGDVLKKEIKSMNMLVFPGTDLLQKQLVKQETSIGLKVSESIENHSQSPVFLEKSDGDSSMERDKQGSKEFNDTKTCDQVNTSDIGSPAPASASNSVSEPTVVCKEISFNSEVENEEKMCNMGSGPLDTPVKDNVDSSAEVTGGTLKLEAPFVKSLHDSSGGTLNAAEANETRNSVASDSTGFLDKSEVEASKTTVNNDSGSEAPSSSTADKVNARSTAFFRSTDVDDDPLTRFDQNPDQLTVPVIESQHSYREPSSDCAATSVPKVSILNSGDVDDNDRCDGTACFTKENVDRVAVVQNKPLVTGDVAPKEAGDSGETGEPDGEKEMPLDVDGKVAAAVSSTENLAENGATTENHRESRDSAHMNIE